MYEVVKQVCRVGSVRLGIQGVGLMWAYELGLGMRFGVWALLFGSGSQYT